MDLYSAIQYVLFAAIVTVLVEPLGGYMERVFSRQRTLLDRLCLPLERLIYRVTAVDPNVEMSVITMTALSYLPALALGPLLERLLFGR